MTLPGRRCAPVYGPPFVRDYEGGRRYATMADFERFVKLGYMSKWLHHSGGTVCEPTDVPVNKRHLDMVYSHIKYSDRAFMGSITAEERAEDSIDMARILFGADFVDRNCVILGNVNVNSPLVWDGTMTKSLRAYARANQAAGPSDGRQAWRPTPPRAQLLGRICRCGGKGPRRAAADPRPWPGEFIQSVRGGGIT